MSYKAEIAVSHEGKIAEISPLIYGSFIEHTGRCVYDGVYAPNTKNADERGFNKQLIAQCKQMKLPIVRYPGGSFIGTWNWEDAIGKKSERKKVLNLPWGELEPSEFGIGEAYEWAKEVGCELMICVNLATGTISDALHLLEYCNFPGGTYYSDLRRSHGYEEPFGIKYFSMGNEPDGWWQINLETSERYAHISAECAKAMKMLDPTIETICCTGLTGSGWTEETLRRGYKYYDHISWHAYIANKENNYAYYMAKVRGYEDSIHRLCKLSDDIGKEVGFEKKLMISADEWNVWYHSLENDKKIKRWQLAPHRLEDIYNLEDALVVGEFLLTFMRCCDRVSMGCMAQLVNVIAPFFTDSDGNVLCQSIFYPYRDACLHGRGVAYKPSIECPMFIAENAGTKTKENPLIDCMVTYDSDGTTSKIALFVINFSEKEEAECEIKLPWSENLEIELANQLWHEDIKAENSFENPFNVSEAPLDCRLSGQAIATTLKPHSWNVIVLGSK